MDYRWALSYTVDEGGCILFIEPSGIIYSNVRWGPNSGSFSLVLGLSVSDRVDIRSRIGDRYVRVVDHNGDCAYLAEKIEIDFRWIQQRALYLGAGFSQVGVGFDIGPSWEVQMAAPQKETIFLLSPCCCIDKQEASDAHASEATRHRHDCGRSCPNGRLLSEQPGTSRAHYNNVRGTEYK